MKYFLLALIIILIVIGCFAAYSFFIIKDVKEPTFDVIEKNQNISIRKYHPMIIAEVTTTGSREVAINKGFRILADYIFGNNKINHTDAKSSKIAMTAPVMQQPQCSEKIKMTAPVIQTSKDDQTWQIRFVMPKKYTVQNLPKPNNKAIKIIEQEEGTYILIKFKGSSSKTNLEKNLTRLNKYIKDNNVKIIGKPIYAFYNPPWTLPSMRRNEILYKLEK